MNQRFLTCSWKHLAMINFEIDPCWLLPFVPPGTEIDLYEGKAFVTLLGFQYDETDVKGCRIPGHVRFAEVNLRFYVRRKVQEQWRRGVCFIKELVGLPLAAWVANACYHESFSCVDVRSFLKTNDQGIDIAYEIVGQGKKSILGVTAYGESREIQSGSMEDFIISHTWAYSLLTNGRTAEYQIHRPAWKYWPADKVLLDFDAERFYGSVLGRVLKGCWHSAFLVDGSRVEVESCSIIPFSPKNSILIFDGICSMCNGFIDFMIRHDDKKSFYLLANQSTKAKNILAVFDMEKKANASVYLVQGGKIFFESTAVLRVFKTLGLPFSILYAFIIIPSCLRNMLYRWIARNRYQWFGQRSTCHFLSNEE